MPTQPYHLKNGTRVPSVTTILSRFKDAGGLIAWAWKLGCEGKDYRKVRDDAATVGTMAHAAVEAWIHKQDFAFVGDPEITSKAQTSFEAFLEWAQQTRLIVDRTEMPLISEKYAFGGTFDAILLDGRRAMGDWKTSNGVYPEYLIQIAAYGLLWDENFPDVPIDGGYHLLRFDKTYGDFSHRYWAELNNARRAFILMRELYDIDKELKARSK